MSLLNKEPFLFATALNASTRTLGVLDPRGEYFGVSISFGSASASGVRLTRENIALETSTDYTVKFFARNTGVGSSVTLDLRLNNIASITNTFSVTNTEWTEYSYTFNSSTATLLENTTGLDNQSELASLTLEFYCVRIYKTSDGDPIESVENKASTTHSTDFSEYTAGSPPSDWTQRIGTDAVANIVADAGAEGGQYLELTRTNSGIELFTWDDIDADANRASGQVLMKFRSNAGYSLCARASGTSSTLDMFSMFLTATSGLGNLDYINGSIDRLDEQDLTEVTYVVDTYFFLEMQFNHDAVLGRAWNASSGSRSASPNVAFGALVYDEGWVGLSSFSANNVDVDTFQFESGTPWFSESVSGNITLSGVAQANAVVDIISCPTVSEGTKTIVEQVTADANGDYSATVSRDTALNYWAEPRHYVEEFTGTLTPVSGTTFSTGVDLSGVSIGGANDPLYVLKSTGGTASGEEVVVESRSGNDITLSYDPGFDGTTTFSLGKAYGTNTVLARSTVS